MADFSLINPNEPNIPFATSSVDKNPLGLTNPDSILSGTSRGQQRINNTDGSYMLLGELPNNNGFGVGFYDATGNLISRIIGPTQYVYDITNNKNIMQIGKLPDGTYGVVVAKTGFNVTDAFS